MKSYGHRPLSRELAVQRGLRAINPKLIGETIGYELGYGGRNPVNPTPATDGHVHPRSCDCSGLVAWTLGYDRYQVHNDGEGEWLNTDGILRAARDHYFQPTFVDFRFLEADEEVLPGDVLVYTSTYKNNRRTPGHTGIIVDVGEKFQRGEPDWWKHLSTVHCTPRAHPVKEFAGHSIRVSNAVLWAKRGYIVRYTGFVEE